MKNYQEFISKYSIAQNELNRLDAIKNTFIHNVYKEISEFTNIKHSIVKKIIEHEYCVSFNGAKTIQILNHIYSPYMDHKDINIVMDGGAIHKVNSLTDNIIDIESILRSNNIHGVYCKSIASDLLMIIYEDIFNKYLKTCTHI